MPPAAPTVLEPLCNLGKLLQRHLRQAVEVDERPAPRGLGPDDITARGLGVRGPEQAVAEVDERLRAEGAQDALRGGRLRGRQGADEVRDHALVGLRRPRQELLEDLERVGAVAASPGLHRGGALLGILAGVVWDAGWLDGSVSVVFRGSPGRLLLGLEGVEKGCSLGSDGWCHRSRAGDGEVAKVGA